MLNTLKSIPKSLTHHQVTLAMQEAAGNVWSANINALHVTRDETMKVLGAVAQTADHLRARNVKALKTGIVAANTKVNKTWHSVEKVIDTRLVPTLDKVGLARPAQFGADMVGKSLAKVSAQVVALTKSGKPAARKTTATRTAARKVAARKPVAKAAVARRGKPAASAKTARAARKAA